MLTITLTVDSSNRIKGFEAKGHSGYAEEGSDIVCAAASALTQTVVLGLNEVLGLNVAVSKEKGNLRCELPELPESDAEKAAILLDTMALGLERISEDYSGYLKVERRYRR